MKGTLKLRPGFLGLPLTFPRVVTTATFPAGTTNRACVSSKKPVKDEEISFSDWLRQKRQIHAGHRNERLWSVTSELYTKTLAGVVVDKHLQLSFVHLETAKEWLDAGFPLITEWLSTPHAARALGKRLCFADGSGKPPIHVPKRRAAPRREAVPRGAWRGPGAV